MSYLRCNCVHGSLDSSKVSRNFSSLLFIFSSSRKWPSWFLSKHLLNTQTNASLPIFVEDQFCFLFFLLFLFCFFLPSDMLLWFSSSEIVYLSNIPFFASYSILFLVLRKLPCYFLKRFLKKHRLYWKRRIFKRTHSKQQNPLIENLKYLFDLRFFSWEILEISYFEISGRNSAAKQKEQEEVSSIRSWMNAFRGPFLS